MRFVTVRELRGTSAAVWCELADEQDLVVTSNGKPIAVLSATTDEGLEDTLAAMRRARAVSALMRLQQASVAAAADQLSPEQIRAEIAAARQERRR